MGSSGKLGTLSDLENEMYEVPRYWVIQTYRNHQTERNETSQDEIQNGCESLLCRGVVDRCLGFQWSKDPSATYGRTPKRLLNCLRMSCRKWPICRGIPMNWRPSRAAT